MASKRKVILLGYASILTLMLLFPPTLVTSLYQNPYTASHSEGPNTGGYRFVASLGQSFDPPVNGGIIPQIDHVTIDYTRLGFQIVIVTLIAVASYAAFRDEVSRRRES